jgi:hypothetical protein
MMMKSSHKFLLIVLVLVAIVWPNDALSLSWGFSAGISYLLPEEWGYGCCLTGRLLRQRGGHMQYGVVGTSELWLPVSGTPSGRIGAEWESSGSAWLFELGPIVRVFTARPESDKLCLYGQGGAGVTFVSSDAEIIVYPVMPDPTGTPLEIMGSQTVPYVEIGVGIHAPFRKLLGEFLIASRTLFADPETAFSISFTIGVNF